ncbi:hypothetical protein GON05_29235 [Paenibacillus sp. MAH-34]|uniref:Uncharacterized protein n=1 Tax=Paenibacillus anseongense TaxID=2682845 RepID=A0ABW9UHP2_9BACL|nr:hypothetical protein [Paenibacillus anseongense]
MDVFDTSYADPWSEPFPSLHTYSPKLYANVDAKRGLAGSEAAVADSEAK